MERLLLACLCELFLSSRRRHTIFVCDWSSDVCSSDLLLCCSVAEDTSLANAQSIADGSMASVLCVLLRTPRARLGILHLDRSYWQKPFNEDDLHLEIGRASCREREEMVAVAVRVHDEF